MNNILLDRRVIGGLATCAVLVVCIQVGLNTGNQIGTDRSFREHTSPESAPQVMHYNDTRISDTSRAIGNSVDSLFGKEQKDEQLAQDSHTEGDRDDKAIPQKLLAGKIVREEEQQLGKAAELSGGTKRKSLQTKGYVATEDVLRGTGTIAKNDIADLAAKRTRPVLVEQSQTAAKPLQTLPRGLTNTPMSPPAPGTTSHFQRTLEQARQMNRERYGQWEENQPTLVTDEPVSTFSIDVDTGSYTNARRFLRNGTLPPKDAVRIEEFVNYFDYNYPVQTEQPFTLSYEIAPNPLDAEKHLLKLGIKAKDALESDKPWNLVFLVDVSGSMSSSDKLALVKRSLILLVNRMRPQDRVSLVTYAGYTGVALPPTGIDDKARIIAAIEGLGAGGSTNGGAGIIQAYDVAERARIPNGVNRVVLATDGDFNVGMTSRQQLIKLIEEKRATGTTLTTLGVGTGNYNEATMEQLANKGNGNYFYLDSFKEARKVFETQLAGTMEVVAKDVKLQIEFNPAHVAQYRLIGYENRKLRKQDFNNDAIDAGEIGSGHTVTALYELVLTGSEAAAKLTTESRYQANKREVKPTEHSNELAFLKIRYKAPEGTTSKLLRFPLLAEELKDNATIASDDFRFAAAVSGFAHLLRQSTFVGESSFTDVLKVAEGALGADKHGYRREFLELVKNANATR